MRPHSILSLDLGTNLGWCFLEGTEYRHSNTKSLAKNSEHPGLMFVQFQNWLQDFRGVNGILFEIVPRFESTKSAQVYCGLLAVLQIFRLTHGIPTTGMKSNTVKKIFTGNGNADKALVCKVAHQLGWQGGYVGSDVGHDEADAIALAYSVLHRRHQHMTFPLSPEPQESVFIPPSFEVPQAILDV